MPPRATTRPANRGPDDAAIRAAILATYRAREPAPKATRPTLPELWMACGTRSPRVTRLRNAMQDAGELPPLKATLQQQAMDRLRRGGRRSRRVATAPLPAPAMPPAAARALPDPSRIALLGPGSCRDTARGVRHGESGDSLEPAFSARSEVREVLRAERGLRRWAASRSAALAAATGGVRPSAG